MEPEIRIASDTDKDKILELLNTVFSGQQRASGLRGREYWKWKFHDSPFGKAILSVAQINNRIIAVNNLWRWEFNVRGSVLKALQPCDSVVHPDYRGKGLFKMMRFHGLEIARAQDIKFLFNYPNENSLTAYLSLGWHYMGRITWLVKVLKPIKVLHGMVSPGKTEPVIIDNKYSIDPGLVDDLAEKSRSFDRFIKTNWIPGFHEWRYLKHPHRYYGMVNYDKGGKSTIAIFTVNQNGRNREMVVVDLIGSTGNTIQVLKMATEACRKLDAGFIAIMDNPRFETRDLWKIGFFKWKSKNMVVLPLDPLLESIVSNYSGWSLMAGMHDSI